MPTTKTARRAPAWHPATPELRGRVRRSANSHEADRPQHIHGVPSLSGVVPSSSECLGRGLCQSRPWRSIAVVRPGFAKACPRATWTCAPEGPYSPRRDASCQKRRYRWWRKGSLNFLATGGSLCGGFDIPLEFVTVGGSASHRSPAALPELVALPEVASGLRDAPRLAGHALCGGLARSEGAREGKAGDSE